MIKSKLAVALVATSAAFGLSQAAFASDTDSNASPDAYRQLPVDFAVLDVNKDGYVDKKEANKLPALVTLWNKVDTDKDGRVTQSEYQIYLNDRDTIKKSMAPQTTPSP